MASNPICSIHNCSKPVNAGGMCSMHYARLKRHGDPFHVSVHARFMDVSGQRFGRLTAIEISGKEKPDGTGCHVWRCVCDCGKETKIARSKLTTGHTRSCGCLINEGRRERAKHGMLGTPEYRAWSGMKSRCSNQNNPRFKYYGGRGISVCDEWAKSFEAFYSHIGDRPGYGYSLDRIDVNGNYEPGNVRWADWKTQRANRRDSG